MWSIFQLAGSAFGLGVIAGLLFGDWLDFQDVLYPFWKHFRKRISSASYWDLIRMSNEIDFELETRKIEKEHAQSQK